MNFLPIETFRQFFQLHPWHFWQLAGTKAPIVSGCDDLVREFAWQNSDGVGREDVRLAVDTAESKLRQFLGYSPSPHYVVETLPFPRYPDIHVNRLGYGAADGRWMTLQLKEGKVIKIGSQQSSLIGSETVSYSDLDGDGLDESFEISIATTVTDTDELAVYFSSADRWDGSGVGDKWQILPLNISISGGIATIKGKAWQLVRPVLYQGYAGSSLDALDSTNYVTTLDVWRVYQTSGTGGTEDAQAVLIWETLPYPEYAYPYPSPNGTDPASQAYLVARCNIRDANAGIVTIGESAYNSDTGEWVATHWSDWNRPPDRVEIRYMAGASLVSGQVQEPFKAMVCRLAAAEMARAICACQGANREIYRWQFDLSRSSGAADESYAYISKEDLNNPLGTCRGQVFAWKQVKAQRILRSFSV